MTAFGSIWLIALAWCFLQGSISLANLLLGVFLGLLVFIFSLSFNGLNQSWVKLKASSLFVLYVFRDLVVSSIRVAWDILTPTVYARPRVVRIPVDDLDEVAITLLANAISLTPGSLALEVSADQQYLYVHMMYAENRDEAVNKIYYELGNRVRAACGIKEIER